MRKGRFAFIPCISWRRGSLQKRESLKTEENFRQQERRYEKYDLNLREWIAALSGGVCLAAAASYTCYRNWAAFLIFLIPAGFFPQYCREYWRKERLRKLELQFKETIQILSSSLSAGYSVENAIVSCQKELEMMYGPDGLMAREIAYMTGQMRMNRPIETLMNEFADRSGLEDVENFSRIFTIAKRSGGQLVPIISHTVQIMDDRFQVKEELRTLTASRKFEQKIMSLMPFLIILYIDTSSPGFFTVMYTTFMGRFIMTICFMVYLLSCYLSRRILNIQVG